jgi:hypothetical protein
LAKAYPAREQRNSARIQCPPVVTTELINALKIRVSRHISVKLSQTGGNGSQTGGVAKICGCVLNAEIASQ